MLRVVIMVDAPGWQAQGVKESLAMEPEPVRMRRA